MLDVSGLVAQSLEIQFEESVRVRKVRRYPIPIPTILQIPCRRVSGAIWPTNLLIMIDLRILESGDVVYYSVHFLNSLVPNGPNTGRIWY